MRISAIIATLVLLAVSIRAQSDQAAIGKKFPDFRFADVAVNDDFVGGGDGWLGRPVLYEFWGFR
ncbi:MAG: hypothetical protein H6807_16145 [Planctomycetes bacterium]|nr:hypothetical protein [Planctomycetota bacterium]